MLLDQTHQRLGRKPPASPRSGGSGTGRPSRRRGGLGGRNASTSTTRSTGCTNSRVSPLRRCWRTHPQTRRIVTGSEPHLIGGNPRHPRQGAQAANFIGDLAPLGEGATSGKCGGSWRAVACHGVAVRPQQEKAAAAAAQALVPCDHPRAQANSLLDQVCQGARGGRGHCWC
jgi:hypothetical protein